jgi:peptidoglycan/xylan/chitin deacetylase (PgdA/CDA1 family)
MQKILLAFILIMTSTRASAKELALSFDDAPFYDSKHFTSSERTEELIRKLKALNVPPVLIFANGCKRVDSASVIAQIKKYRDAGHLIGNHTCSHPRLDNVGFAAFAMDAERGEELLLPLFVGQKFFRFPFLNESKDKKLRDQMREWLTKNKYRNGFVSIDTDDYIFSSKVNEAKDLGKKIDYKKIEKLFIENIIGSANFYDDLAVKTLGHSPKHVLLLHEMDVTVMFLDSLIKELRKQGWKIISAEEAYQDKLYASVPKNTYSGNGLIAQMAMEKTGEAKGYFQIEVITAELNKILELP